MMKLRKLFVCHRSIRSFNLNGLPNRVQTIDYYREAHIKFKRITFSKSLENCRLSK